MGVCWEKRENAGKRRMLGEKEEIGLGTGRIKGIRGECRKKGEKTGQKEKIVGIR
jgi:hypothetical protein